MHCIWCAGFTKLSAAADPVSEPSRVKLSEVAKNSSSSFSSAVSFFNESHINFSYRTFDFTKISFISFNKNIPSHLHCI